MPGASQRKFGKKDSIPSTHTGYCQFELHGKHCPFPGNNAVGGAQGHWYCPHHMLDENRVVDTAQYEFFRIYSDPTCIRDQMEIWYPDEVRGQVNGLVEANPAWQRKPGEGKTEYLTRLQKIRKPLLAGMTKAMPGKEVAA